MNIQTEKFVEMSFHELGLKEKDIDELSAIGLRFISENKKDLANYAINKFLSDIIYENGPDISDKKRINILKETIRLKLDENMEQEE